MSTLTLKHTGLQVPAGRRVTLAAPGLIAVDGDIVGEIRIDPGDDFAEVFAATGKPPLMSADDFFDWAAACRTEGGDRVDPVDVFDYLRAEYATEFALKQAARHGITVAQAMVPHGDGYLPGETLMVFSADTRNDILQRAARCGCPEGTWWRIFNGSGWDEIGNDETP